MKRKRFIALLLMIYIAGILTGAYGNIRPVLIGILYYTMGPWSPRGPHGSKHIEEREISAMMNGYHNAMVDISRYSDKLQLPQHTTCFHDCIQDIRSLGRTLRKINEDRGEFVNQPSENDILLRDSRGNEIYYLVSEDGIIACMSAGPNKIWEFGKGDDLVVDTNMKLSKKLPLPDPPTDSTPVTHPMP